MRKTIKVFAVICTVFSVLLLTVSFSSASNLPDKFWVIEGEQLIINRDVPISVFQKNIGNDKAVPVSIAGQSYKANLKMLGIFPIKEVNVEIVKQNMVVPCGTSFGIKMYTQGVVIVGTSLVDGINPSKNAGIKEGDIILSIDKKMVNSNEDVANIIEQSAGKALTLSMKRKNESFETELIPILSKTDQIYKAGIWVRDSSAGIGTMTFYDPQSGAFGGLGHGICDVDTGEIMPLMSGEIVPVTITGIVKGADGAPGEIKGYFRQEISIGTLLLNNETGVFGKISTAPVKNIEALPVAMKQQVKTGYAQIITTLTENKVEYFDIEIEKVNYNENSPTRNMIIKITDKKLLDQTGGIIQGMSGSPIIQNGNIVGAVTHVFINDSKRGYGIFAENMLKSAKSAELKKVG